MGLYDEIEVGDRIGQVKCFDSTMATYRQGERLPEPYGGDFSIAMREGGFVNVVRGIIVDWTDEPQQSRVIDKYGDLFSPERGGLFGEGYVFDR